MTSLADRARAALSQTSGRITLRGLTQPVEVLRDPWGIPHIYAHTADDLFFAQGFVAAQDRLWQMEMWRRTGEGRLAEVLGPSALERDIFARLVRYRGDMDAEWQSYAPDARQIIEAFVRGINAYIELTQDRPPLEFEMMGIAPEPWTPEVCLTRMAGYIMSRNIGHEVVRSALIHRLGPEATAKLLPTDPPIDIESPAELDLANITTRILSSHTAAISSLSFQTGEGSNNWVVNGTKSATGKPILANDPHRTIALPALRYITHLVGPGWNVIGAGEPSLPGVAVGHNERVAFGFTIFMTDSQDVYVEETHPDDPIRYRYKESWESMRTETETFRVKGHAEPVEVELRFTRHGPVIYEDRARHRAYALRWTGSEPGTAGYLAALSLNRATNWDDFLSALERWKLPSENLVYADVDGNIGYQVAGLIPIRRNWTGLLPVAGSSGEYEWEGFLTLSTLPAVYNPASGFIATANHRTLAPDDPRHIGYEWDPGFRFTRIEQVLRDGGRFTVADFERLQGDELSLPAGELVPLLGRHTLESEPMRAATQLLLDWDRILSKDSPAAALYEMWYTKLVEEVIRPRVPDDLWTAYVERYPIAALLGLVKKPDAWFGPDPVVGRDAALTKSLIAAVAELSAVLGTEMSSWRWGALHTVTFAHPLADAASQAFLSRGPVPRSGDGYTVNNTSDPVRANLKQISGASYRQILDVADWDRSVAINVPGQSGQPGSPHYDDLIPLWAEGQYHPLLYNRQAVEAASTERLVLEPEESDK